MQLWKHEAWLWSSRCTCSTKIKQGVQLRFRSKKGAKPKKPVPPHYTKKFYGPRAPLKFAQSLKKSIADIKSQVSAPLARDFLRRFAKFVREDDDLDLGLEAGFAVGGSHARQSERIRDPQESRIESSWFRQFLQILRVAYNTGGSDAVITQVRYACLEARPNGELPPFPKVSDLQAYADFRYPHEFFAQTRVLTRKIHLHVGPTNSGKTYRALQRLEQARNGVYAGPLRLLAHEVYARFQQSGLPCSLVTGDERMCSSRDQAQGSLLSCTVEMVPLSPKFDVAVIDEIQMLEDEQRGWAWTEAFLGVNAPEVHLCGEERVVPLLETLTATTGDELHVHHYERLSPLKTMDESLEGSLAKLQKGDCFVAFSRVALHDAKNRIEQVTKRRVAMVHGGLPPEVRAQQARLFNEPDNDYDYLVASDAIGMGLNLAVKRIIFSTLSKFDGASSRPVKEAQIKQIAGRAGRFRVAGQAESAAQDSSIGSPAHSNAGGLVTTLQSADLHYLQKAMVSNAKPIQQAGMLPSAGKLKQFAAQLPHGTPLSTVMLRFAQNVKLLPHFKLCTFQSNLRIADIIADVPNISLGKRIVFSNCPFPSSSKLSQSLTPMLKAYAQCLSNQTSGRLLDIPEVGLDILDAPVSAKRTYIERLGNLHTSLILYLWLGFRFPGVFIDRDLAMHVRSLVEYQMHKVLSEFSTSEEVQKRMKEMQQEAVQSFGSVSDEDGADGSVAMDAGSNERPEVVS